MPKKSKSQRERTKLPVFDSKGKSRMVSVSRLDLRRLVSEFGFDSSAAFFEANADLFYLFGHKKEITLPPAKDADKKEGKKPLSPEDIERALRILLRAIASASLPQLARVPPPEEETVDGRPAVEITRKEDCECPCPDGIKVDFLIEWDAAGPVNPDLFSDSLSRGVTQNPAGQAAGETVEIEGDKTVTLNFGNPALGQLNTGDIIATFTLKPFFGAGFDEEACCITATGSFVGVARIASFTNRGQANERVARGRTRINQTIRVGDCELKEGQEPCCTAVYRWLFAKGFTVNALGFDVEATVRGIITAELKVWKIGG